MAIGGFNKDLLNTNTNKIAAFLGHSYVKTNNYTERERIISF